MKKSLNAEVVIIGSYLLAIFSLFLVSSCEKEAIEKPVLNADPISNSIEVPQENKDTTLFACKYGICKCIHGRDCPDVWNDLSEKSGDANSFHKQTLAATTEAIPIAKISPCVQGRCDRASTPFDPN